MEGSEESASAAGPSRDVSPAQAAIIKETVEAVLRACSGPRSPMASGAGGGAPQAPGSEPPDYGGRGK